METTIEVNGKPVKITLTKEQVEAIKKADIKITDRVKTYEDACEVLAYDAECRLPYEPTTSDADEKASNAFTKMAIIAKALNEGWKPDWNNSNEYKYFPWFKRAAGFGFSYDDWTYTNTGTGVGSRLCFKTSALAEYAGKQFEAIYKDFYTL